MAANLNYSEAGSSSSGMAVRASCMRVHRSPSTKDPGLELPSSSRSSPAKPEGNTTEKQNVQGKSKINRPVSWHESVPQLSVSSSTELDLGDSNRNLDRQHSRRGSRRVGRSASAREGPDPVKVRPKVRRSISERGSTDGDQRSRHHHHHKSRPHRQGSKRSGQKSRAQSVQSSVSGIEVSSLCSRATSETKSRQQSLTETVAVELGLAETAGVSPKESRRRRIVFAVVLISLVLLTTSVFLVAITLLLSPAVDAVIRKENEEILRVLVTQSPNHRPEVLNQTLPSTTATTTGQPG